MHVFESLLALLFGATLLSMLARRLHVPYPTLLALGGALLAFLPSGPRLELPPDLILALFVAPVLSDAAYDSSLRDLKRNWVEVSSLVLVAVGLTTLVVALVVRIALPDMPWGAAIALGALLAPPDAVAALAILRAVAPPYRLRVILEGESLLNDASSLLIYRLGIGAVAAGSFSWGEALPAFALVFVGSAVAGFLFAQVTRRLIGRMTDGPSATIFQFVVTFGAWLGAERLGLSGVVTVVVFAITAARGTQYAMRARLRVASFAVWETVTVVLNVLAFTLIGLELRPILETLTSAEQERYIGLSLLLLVVVILVRLAWVVAHHGLRQLRPAAADETRVGVGASLVVGWSGMRGIVTLAAAIALPADFPYRDFMQLAAFVVVLGTLLIQGLTLGPLLRLLRLPEDRTVDNELRRARKTVIKAGLAELDGDTSPAARRIADEYAEALSHAMEGADLRERPENHVRLRMVDAARREIGALRDNGTIGDEAYRRVEEELDWLEMSARPL
ncbi:cation:proton antiporter [Aureimonas jatrophae]|uniref:Sodium/proton antiporter, CPA1 family n=1 Tax=Aureimonas jatrophae TaxID=1166073 RepID=A0A1H0LAG0_9HYPH|nr:sodium:proton antiporter [Aureimonas jatrophae]MBB3952474.1 CPA1 family monovalent cation:H+ antiporter [Aureimonas jatrophae]SDO65056.1 sodium/proton antiporter, CPA1 family [Aureimonas jatrophae]